MRARILKRTHNLDAANIACASAGSVDALGVGFNLDEAAPVARKFKDDGSNTLGERYFGRGDVISLKRSELQPVEVDAQVEDGYVEWDIQADVIVDGQQRTITIDDSGKPFRVTGAPARARYHRYYEWVWYVTPQYLYVSSKDDMKSSEQLLALSKTRHCGGGAAAGPNTSCAFAVRVLEALRKSRGTSVACHLTSRAANAPECRAITITSTVTKGSYAMMCTVAPPVVCRGGDDAAVYLGGRIPR